MIRTAITLTMLLGVTLAGAQQKQLVYEITGEVVDDQGHPVPPPIDISVGPCSPTVVDSGGRFVAKCSAVEVHPGELINIKIKKDGWITYQFIPAVPEGGAFADPIHIQRNQTRNAAPAAPPSHPQVSVTFNVSDANFETTLTVLVRNLTPRKILLDDLIIHIDQVYEIRQAIGAMPLEKAVSLTERDLQLVSSEPASDSHKHIGTPLDSTSESPPLVLHLLDDSKATDRDFIYRARVEVTWRGANDERLQRVPNDNPVLFLIRGQRDSFDPESSIQEPVSSTQEKAKTAFEWNHRQLEQLAGAKGRRTKEVESLIDAVKRFEPMDVQPGFKLDDASKASPDTVEALLVAGADRGKTYDPKVNLIEKAAKDRNWELVAFLIGYGMDLEQSGGYVLDLAAEADDLKIVNLLLSKGINPSAMLPGAARAGHLDMVQLAFNRGAKGQPQDLCEAVLGGNMEILNLMLAQGVRNSGEPCSGIYRNSAMAAAAQSLREDMLRALVDNMDGTESARRSALGSILVETIDDSLRSPAWKRIRPVVALLLKLNADVHQIGVKEIASDAEIAEMLVKAGADIRAGRGSYELTAYNRPDNGIFPANGESFDLQNGSVLLYAANAQYCNLNLVKTLLALGAVKVPFRLRRYGKDVLQEALQTHLEYGTSESFGPVECLLRAGADPTAPLPQFQQPWLVEGAARGDVPLIRLLLENGADPNVQDSQGSTALVGSFKDHKESLEMMKVLLEHGTNPNTKNSSGESPLTSAFEQQVVPMDIVHLLEDHKENYDLTGFSYLTYSPLTKCAEYGDLPCVNYLLSKGEDPKKRDQGGRKPIEVAESPEIREAIQEAINHPRR
jgi:ankyrin repeat protein